MEYGADPLWGWRDSRPKTLAPAWQQSRKDETQQRAHRTNDSRTAVAPAVPVDLSSAGLTMIETDPNKAVGIVPVVVENRPQAPRRRQRQREVYTIENSEPLQQVETQSPN